MQKKSNEFVAIGLMLFALFFGAGNLIFPVFMGQNAGINVTWATLGFLITGVGLPFAGVLAVCYSGDDLQNLASRVAPWYGVAFTVLLYLTIGPFFAIPLLYLMKLRLLRCWGRRLRPSVCMSLPLCSLPSPGGWLLPQARW